MIEGMSATSLQLITTTYIGHVNSPTALSSLVLANTVYNVTGYSIVSGLASAMETLCGQAYGAGNYGMLGIVLQRAQLACSTLCLPVILAWSTGIIGKLLIAIGQPEGIVLPATRYLSYLPPALLLSVVSETTAQYLLAQNVAVPAMVYGGGAVPGACVQLALHLQIRLGTLWCSCSPDQLSGHTGGATAELPMVQRWSATKAK
eukprot:jgi/Chrzof1/8203/Cz03g01120.t1